MAEGSRGWLRSKRLWVGLVLLGVLVGVGVGVALGWRAAMSRSLVSRRCADLERVDLEIEEIVELKKRWKAYIHSDEPDAALTLTPRETSFLLRGESAVGVWLEGEGSLLHALVTVPVDGGCYNVDYAGQVEVRDGLAILDVQELKVGQQDLSALTGLGGALGSPRQAIGPDDVEDPEIRAALANIERLEVVDGHIQVRFVDPDRVWR